MSPFAFLLALAAAAMHAAWNFVLKEVGEKHVFTWLAVVAGSVIYLPLLALKLPIPDDIWLYALSSAAAEAVYFYALVRAYEKDDFSLIYPVARGTAPALLVLWTMLFLGEHPRTAGLAGLGVLLLGLLVVSGTLPWLRSQSGRLDIWGVLAALRISFFISVYSVIDGAAVRLMEPQAYTVLVLGLTAVFVAPFIFARYGWAVVVAEGRAHFKRILAVGVLMILAYVLVLQAYTLAPMSYVAALRELSVVMAAVAGWRLLGEDFGIMRTIGAVMIFCGIVVIVVLG